MHCPCCQATNVTGHGDQVVSITEIYVDDDLQEYTNDDWHEKLGTWAWECRACGHLWNIDEGPRIGGAAADDRMTPADLRTTAAWIIEEALQAELFLTGFVPDYEGVALKLDAIATYAKNIFDALKPKETV